MLQLRLLHRLHANAKPKDDGLTCFLGESISTRCVLVSNLPSIQHGCSDLQTTPKGAHPGPGPVYSVSGHGSRED